MQPEDGRIRQAGITALHDTSPLDDIDRKIVRLLHHDGRASNTEIGRALGVSETTVRKRIARLLDEHLIMVTAVPTPRGMGTTMAVLIGVNLRLDKQEEICARLFNHSSVRYISRTTGRYDVVLEAYFRDVEHLATFIANDLGADPAITHVETSLILKVEKFVYEWEIP